MVFVVEIEDRAPPKPFLGGWRDVARDLEFHDATSQTPPLAQPRRAIQRTSVLVQTAISVRATRSVAIGAPGIERAVQAGPPFPEIGETVVVPRGAEELLRRLDAALKIQRCYRAYRTRQSFKEEKFSCSSGIFVDVAEEGEGLQAERPSVERSTSGTESQDYHSVPDILGQFQIEPQPGSGPRDYIDFKLLRILLDRWAVAEEARIREIETGRARIAAQRCRLEREIEFLRAIERFEGEAARRRAELARARFLKELSKPVILEVPSTANSEKKTRVKMETLEVQRARQFRDLYETVLMQDEQDEVKEAERVELLLALKKVASQHTCATATSLERLIDQELYLISSRVNPAHLAHLRNRVRLNFLRLARNALHRDNRIKYPMKTKLCPSCGRLRRIQDFEDDHRGRPSRICYDCAALRPRRRESEMCPEIYAGMLKELRKSEAARPDALKSLAFVMTPQAIRYLVNDIWQSRSGVSGCDDLERLKLVRLDPSAPWSPWNTLLATRREAKMHEALFWESEAADPYDAELLRKLRRMNLQARLYFESLVKFAESESSIPKPT